MQDNPFWFLDHIRLIGLTQSKVAIVDVADYERLSSFQWRAQFDRDTRGFYAVRGIKENGKNKAVLMHRVILGAKPGETVDHIDRDTLDNRRANLRIVTKGQNSWNQRLLHAQNTSGFRGVCWSGTRWLAQITVNNRLYHLGCFDTPEAAAKAYDRAARELHQGFTPLNFPSI
jgi:hypothetical protein